jgi:predicted glycoside hydrolase/deacetylase ChbG (UPF0249 family)
VKIIINADDLGISLQVNEAIYELIAEGRVTSATLIVNGPGIADAARRVHLWPKCSFGAHLNLTEFRPVTKAGREQLTMPNGEMSRRNIEHAWPSPRILQAVYEEFSAQIQKLIDLGVPVSHLDSHQHAHTIPQIFPALKAVQKRFALRRIRPSRNLYFPEKVGSMLLLKKRLFNFALKTVYASRMPDGFTDLPTLLKLDAKCARQFRSVEVMIHPGASGQEQETAVLRGPWMELLPFAAEPCSYHQI